MESTRLPDLEAAERALLDAFVPGAKVRRVSWSGGETQVIEAGSGPPVLFMHGGFSQSSEWIPLWPRLASRWRLLAVDRPGHGMADPFDYSGRDVREVAARFLSEILDVLATGPLPVVANSMGGRWALESAFREPARFRQLILVGAPAGSISGLPRMLLALRWPFTRPLIRRAFRNSTPASVRDFFGRVLVTRPETLPDPLLVSIAAGQRRQVESLLSFATRVMTFRAIHPDLVLTGAWSRLRVPTHFIWGEEDAFDGPETGRVATSRIAADAGLTTVPGAGHLPWLDDPGAVARAIESALFSVAALVGSSPEGTPGS